MSVSQKPLLGTDIILKFCILSYEYLTNTSCNSSNYVMVMLESSEIFVELTWNDSTAFIMHPYHNTDGAVQS